jgi:carboxypeptidase PM20D1
MWRKIPVWLGGILLVLAVIIVTRTILYTSPQLDSTSAVRIDIAAEAVPRLAGAISLPTVSSLIDVQERNRQFATFQQYLADAFPNLHTALRRETFNEFALLYTWQGTDPDLKPLLLLSHQDVVPIEPGTEPDWIHPPFSGAVDDGYVWGRGAWDDKSTLMASLEAIEMLVGQGVAPRRSVMLAFGHDEEIGGRAGATVIAAELLRRGLQFELILDEGGTIRAPGLMPGIDVAAAMVAIAEKGYLTLKLTARDSGGHSSMPPPLTAAGRVSRAVSRLQDNPLPARLNPPVREMLKELGPHMPLSRRVLLANLWLFEPLLVSQMTASRGTNAAVRTTTAPTMLRAGVKENVLPQAAEAIVNFRIVPNETSASVIAAVKDIIDDSLVEVDEAGSISSEPSRVSSVDSSAYRELSKTIRQVRPDVVVAPSLLYGATDSRHYGALSVNVFRFTPITVGSDDLGRIHGTNERISVADYENAVRFYYQLLTNMALQPGS